MITRKRFLTFLTTAVMALALVTTSSFVTAEKGGKGGGNGKPDPNPTLPADLDVRYRVQFIPLPASAASNYAVHDINDVYEVVGGYNDVAVEGNLHAAAHELQTHAKAFIGLLAKAPPSTATPALPTSRINDKEPSNAPLKND